MGSTGTIFRELAPASIGLDPIKPCTLIFPMGFGALIQIGWINTVQRVANTCKLKHDQKNVMDDDHDLEK